MRERLLSQKSLVSIERRSGKLTSTSVFVTKQRTPQLTNKKIQYTHLSLKLRVVIMRICALTTIQTTTTRCCCSLLLFFIVTFTRTMHAEAYMAAINPAKVYNQAATSSSDSSNDFDFEPLGEGTAPVSYTHLTLPTMIGV